MDDLLVTPDLLIPASELTVRFTRSGGPGGQHVNTSATRVELLWNVASSMALSDEQRVRLLDRLASRLDGEGNLRIVAAATRSQTENRVLALLRLRATIASALRVLRPRRATRPTTASRARRRAAKERRAEVKRGRQDPEAP